jgi:hypothetical protein
MKAPDNALEKIKDFPDMVSDVKLEVFDIFTYDQETIGQLGQLVEACWAA